MNHLKFLLLPMISVVLSACGGGGGDGPGISARSYAPGTLVVRVNFVDGPAFRQVAAVDSDRVELRVIFDMNDDDAVSEGDISLYYTREYVTSAHVELIELQEYSGGTFVEVPASDVDWYVDINTLEWAVANDQLPAAISAATPLQVVARKFESTPMDDTSDYIPETIGTFDTLTSNAISDASNDYVPLDGSSTVDLRSVRVLFY